MKKNYIMGIFFKGQKIYEIEVEANDIETAREITWDNFIQEACADESFDDEA